MPLQNSTRPLSQAGEGRKAVLSKGRPSTASSRETSQHRGASTRDSAPRHGQESIFGNKLSNTEAEALKVDVPNTLPSTPDSFGMKRQTSQSTDEEKEDNEPYQIIVKSEPGVGYPSRQRSQHYQQDDDDTSITFSETGWEADHDPYGQQTTIFRGDASNKIAATIMGNHPLNATATNTASARRGVQTMNHKLVRIQRGPSSEYADGDDIGGLTDDDYDFENDATRHLVNETPSRAGNAPVMRDVASQPKLANRRVEFAAQDDDRESSPIDQDLLVMQPPQRKPSSEPPQPEANPHSSLARHQAQRQELRHFAPQEPIRPPPVNPNVVAKVSGFDELSPEDQQNPFQPLSAADSNKRPYQDIDYDAQDLQGRSYAALDEIPFLTDPRAPLPPPEVDASGNPLQSLSARLSNLSNMRPEDQRNLFLSLTDDENEQAGQFFIQSFSDNLKKLMVKRLERRKIALKYELEARKRHRTVETKQADCEAELTELRTGGNKLVQGKSAAKIGMTPRKAVSTPPP